MKKNKTERILDELEKGETSNQVIATKVGCTKAMVSYVKCNYKREVAPKVVGVIGDLHVPAVRPDYLEFCIDTFRKEGVDQVVFIGDVIDHHTMSRHVSEPGAMSAHDEFLKVKRMLEDWWKAFPVAKICEGNHDMIPKRQAKEVGIPDQYLLDMNAVYGLPKEWEWDYGHIIDGVRYEHGLGSTGQHGCRNTAMKMGMSYVQGHIHSAAGVYWISSERHTIFGMNVGAAADLNDVAMKYSQNYKTKQTTGVGIVRGGKSAYFLPMVD